MTKERRQKEEEETERQLALEAQLAEQLQERIQADAQKHLMAKEIQYKAARRRAQSDATEVPSSGDTLTESFPVNVEFRGICFNAVKIYHPRKGALCALFINPQGDDGIQSIWVSPTLRIRSAMMSMLRFLWKYTSSSLPRIITPIVKVIQCFRARF